MGILASLSWSMQVRMLSGFKKITLDLEILSNFFKDNYIPLDILSQTWQKK